VAGKAKDLNTLIRLHKWTVDEKQRALVALQRREDELILFGEAQEAQMRREQALVSADLTGLAGLSLGHYLLAYRRRREQLAATLAALRVEIEAARDALAEAYRTLKVTEEVQTSRANAEQAERDQKERDMLDDIGQIQHRRRQHRDEDSE